MNFLKYFFTKRINKAFIDSTLCLKYILISAIFFAFSCTDQGCIEADDFGEYETQVLEVLSSANSDSCNYDTSKPMTDAEQGSGIKNCLVSGNHDIFDETGAMQSSTSGCKDLPGAKFRDLCVSECVANCNANASSAANSSPEPNWKSTSLKEAGINGGVTIRPDAEVKIRAIGSISLGSDFEYDPIYLRGDDSGLMSYHDDWSENIIDISAGKILTLSFSGLITDNSSANGGNTPIGKVGAINQNNNNENEIINAARRIVAYIIPHPPNYDFDHTKRNEKAGSINVPLLPDPNMWQCSYMLDNGVVKPDCSNKSYGQYGYVGVVDSMIDDTFPLSADEKTATLGTYGGMIRWQGDGIYADNLDLFQDRGVSCVDTSCPNLDQIPVEYGKIVGDLSSGDITVDSLLSAKISFKYLLPTNVCDGNIEVVVVTPDGNNAISTHNIYISNNGWTTDNISIEKDQKIIVRSDPKTYDDVNSNSVSCGRALAVKFAKYHDVYIERSGFVSFATLGSSVGGSCVIDARIVNPNGSHLDYSVNRTADFYEYADFSSSGDPLKDLTVPILTSTTLWDSGNSYNASKKVFVRKGQVIRFSPESWNNQWNATVGQAECGIGMAMRIEPRPALLCRGYGADQIPNPDCTFEYDAGGLIGCKAEVDPQCFDSNSSAYCPVEKCHRTVVCDPGSDSSNPPYTKTNCVLDPYSFTFGSLTDPDVDKGETMDECPLAYKTQPSNYNRASCNACSNFNKSNASQSPYLDVNNISFCYDLEDYTGKVENIPISGFSSADLQDVNISKGAREIAPFDGRYGNIGAFQNIGTVDQKGNEIFQAQKVMSVNSSGRLKFLFLDGDNFKDFNNFYGDNSQASGSGYNGKNGFKVGLSGYLDFNNGQWLEAILCKETSSNSTNCRANTRPNSLDPKLIELDDPAPGVTDPSSLTSFRLNEFGELTRTKPKNSSKECDNALVGDLHYCHKSNIDYEKLRIAFKIKDPEEGTCYVNNPTGPKVQGQDYDGIIITNSKFVPSNCNTNNPALINPQVKNGISGVDNQGNITCTRNGAEGKTCVPADGPDCTKEFVCVNKYYNNSGRYYVTVRVKNPTANISAIVKSVVNPVVEIMDGNGVEPVDGQDVKDYYSQLQSNANNLSNSSSIISQPIGDFLSLLLSANQIDDDKADELAKKYNQDNVKIGQAERIYRLIIDDPRYQAILNMALVMMFTFYGFTYLMGISDASISDIVSRMVKIGIIYLFVGPQGWEWFDSIVVSFFKDSTDYLSFLMASSFDDSPELINAIKTNDFSDKSVLFSSVDEVFSLFFASAVQKKISALLFANLFGFVYILIIYYAIISYIYAVSTAVLLYLTAQIFISVLFVLGPLFFIMTLFGPTKEMFDKWLQQLIGFSLQQIFLLTTLSFFNMMMIEVTKIALGYKVCWDEVWTINIITRITLMSFWSIPSLPPNVDSQIEYGSIGKNDGIPSFFAILFMWVIAKLMYQFMNFMTEVASDIGGGVSISKLGAGIQGSIASARRAASQKLGKTWDTTGGRLVQRADQALFDSGKLASKARKLKREENAKMRSQKSSLDKAGNSAVSEYKKKHGADLARMSKEDQQKALNRVKNDAMVKKGKKMGLSAEQVENLKNDKGIKYAGSNVLGLGASVLRQAASSGGTLTKSLNDKKTSTKFSMEEAKSALKNTDSKGRKDIIRAASSGKISIAERKTYNPKDIKKPSWQQFKKNFVNKDRKEAIKQLQDEGAISTMKMAHWSRDDNEKKLIAERTKQVRDERRADKTDVASASTIADLALEANYQNAKEDSVSNEYRRGGISGRVLGRRKHSSGIVLKDSDARAELKKDIIKERLKSNPPLRRLHEAVETSNNKKDKKELESLISGKIDDEVEQKLERLADRYNLKK